MAKSWRDETPQKGFEEKVQAEVSAVEQVLAEPDMQRAAEVVDVKPFPGYGEPIPEPKVPAHGGAYGHGARIITHVVHK